ncbi:hypothetical protein GT755_03785 [Herbidospora sp. NEAU-GS84]|uniref:Mandelate racemase/muconate lactonizing enzyme N-terminal domain-containing protein n=1 Tax=Herbidospora solisilvae TaxID=2696284 RepID=A0A7C9JBR7_9ACTN|nr:hypothetical protein [Herbidospora solisilvae]NAS20803.1 hypothetical protein [Herbidospora solisilvae]
MAPVDHVAARAYRVPTPEPETDGTLGWDATTVVVVHVRAADVTGLGWTYADAACVPLVEGVLARAVTGRPGLVSCAISAVDIALWDAAARSVGLPLCRLLGRSGTSNGSPTTTASRACSSTGACGPRTAS